MKLKNIDIDLLKPAKYNPRRDLKPGDKEYKAIERSIKEFGIVDPLVVNRDMTVIGGHQRLKVLRALAVKTVPCVVVDLDKKREAALNVALNRIAGAWDYAKLRDVLSEIGDGGIDLEITGFDADELKGIFDCADIPVLDSIADKLTGTNYGDSRSGTGVPINILGIGGMVDRALLEKIRHLLVDMGAKEGQDNGAYIGQLLTRLL